MRAQNLPYRKGKKDTADSGQAGDEGSAVSLLIFIYQRITNWLRIYYTENGINSCISKKRKVATDYTDLLIHFYFIRYS